MNTRKLESIRKTLESRISQLQAGIATQNRTLTEEDLSGRHADLADSAQFENDHQLWAGLNHRAHLSLSELRIALKRIDQGEFDECCDCGSKIEERRLLANPTTKLCIVCQEDLERETSSLRFRA